MAKDQLPPPEILRKLLDYDPVTGLLIWKPRTAQLFTANQKTPEHQAKIWNARYAEKPALNGRNHGYPGGHVFGVQVKAHRVIWAMQTGEWPVGEIDHINGIRHDNRWDNLRQVSSTLNSRNNKRNSGNSSGVNGVTWHKRVQKWRAFIRVDYKQVHIGYFVNLADAQAARKAAEVGLGFTSRHGTHS